MSSLHPFIPTVDVERIGMHRKATDIDNAAIETVAAQLKISLCKYGVCYFKNHGIEYADRYMDISKAFFKQPLEVKSQHLRGTRRDFGYTPVNTETPNPDGAGDLKECFNYQPGDDPRDWEDDEFGHACEEMFDQCTTFGYRVLDALSLALGQRQTFLRDCHKHIGTQKNPTTLRPLYYPPIPQNFTVKPGQIRLGEHSDFGTMTFLFQDDIGGLEVNFPGEGYTEAIPIPGSILVLAADLLQRWCADTMCVSIKHRVLVPIDEPKKRKARQSTVFFIIPDNECVVEPVDGSKKYKPIKCMDYLQPKMLAASGVTY